MSTRSDLISSFFDFGNTVLGLHPTVKYLLRTPGQPMASREFSSDTPKHMYKATLDCRFGACFACGLPKLHPEYQ